MLHRSVLTLPFLSVLLWKGQDHTVGWTAKFKIVLKCSYANVLNIYRLAQCGVSSRQHKNHEFDTPPPDGNDDYTIVHVLFLRTIAKACSSRRYHVSLISFITDLLVVLFLIVLASTIFLVSPLRLVFVVPQRILCVLESVLYSLGSFFVRGGQLCYTYTKLIVTLLNPFSLTSC